MRRIRALVVSVLVLVLLVGAAGIVNASSVYSTIARDHVRKSAWGRLSSWSGSIVCSEIPLYDVGGNVVAWGFDVVKDGQTLGYVIVNAEIGASDAVFEFGIGSGLPFSTLAAQAWGDPETAGTVIETKYLYPGALTYAIQTDVSNGETATTYYWVRGKGLVTRDAPILQRPLRDGILSEPGIGILATEERFVPGVVPDYAWYRGCAPTAAANLLRYWNNYGYPGFSSGSTLIDELADAMGTGL